MKTLQEQLIIIKGFIPTQNIEIKKESQVDAPKQRTTLRLKEKRQRKYKKCPDCGNSLRVENFAKHVEAQHPENIPNEIMKNGRKKKKSTICPVCKTEVFGNIKSHIKKKHKSESTKENQKYKIKKITPEQAAKQRAAIQDQNLGKSPTVQNYVNRITTPDKIGKFGVPQDKYRWGFYGHSTMSYDIWGRN